MGISIDDFDAGNYAKTTYFSGYGCISILAPDYKKAKEYAGNCYPFKGVVKATKVSAERIKFYTPEYDNMKNCIKLYTERIGRVYSFNIDIDEF